MGACPNHSLCVIVAPCQGRKQPRSGANTNFCCVQGHECVETFSVIKPIRYTNFTNLFCHETLHVPDSSFVHHQELIHCTRSRYSQTFTDSFRTGPVFLLESCLQTCKTYTIAECTVNKLLMMDRRTVRNI